MSKRKVSQRKVTRRDGERKEGRKDGGKDDNERKWKIEILSIRLGEIEKKSGKGKC